MSFTRAYGLDNTILFGGTQKAVPLSMLAEAFPTLYGSLDEVADVETAYSAVPWIFRALTIRANAIAGVPWELYYGNSEEPAENPFVNTDMRWLIWRTAAARDLWGASYWKVALKEQALHWLNPQTMSFEHEAALGKGIRWFIQTINGDETRFPAKEIVYLPTWHPNNDLGPGVAPAQVALKSAGLDFNLTQFAEKFFEHGAIPAVLLTTEQTIPEAEVKRIRDVWDRLYQGVKNAWRTAILGRGLKPTVIGQAVKDLGMPDIDQRVMRNIAAAFEMTIAFLTGENANYATAQMDTVNFYANTVTPNCRMIESGLNNDLWSLLGLRFRFKTEAIEAMRQYEATKATAWQGLLEEVNREYESGLLSRNRAVWVAEQLWDAMSFPVAEIEDEMEPEAPEEPEPVPEDVQEMPEESSPEAEDVQGELRMARLESDLRKWRRKALNRGGDCDFESEAIPDALATRVHTALLGAQEDDEIRSVFDGLLEGKLDRFLPAGADEPLLPVPVDEVTITDADVEQAIRAWDKAMPEFAGILDAEVANQDAVDEDVEQ